jgi:hypothetical protein
MLHDLPVTHAGLAARDLRADGGHLTRGIVELARTLGDTPVNLIHIGGETLGCVAWEAAALLQDDAALYSRYSAAPPDTQHAWATQILGLDQAMPYVLPRNVFRNTRCLIHNAVGGVDFAQRPAMLRDAVCRNLRDADFVGVRDTLTRDALARENITTHLLPDCGVMVREVLGEDIARHMAGGAVGALRARYREGYLAVQFSSDFADDATLDELATQLRQAARMTRLPVVLFRAGAAPLHDDLALYQRLAAHLGDIECHCFPSRHILDLCALIAASRGFVGSSLHGRLVALAYGLPRVSILPPALCGRPNKQQAFADTWQDPYPVVACDRLAQNLGFALDREADHATAQRLCTAYQQGFDQWRSLLAAT